MSRPAQDRIRKAWPRARRYALLAVLFLPSPALTACASHGPDIAKLAIDSGLVTGSIERAAEPIPEAESDAEAIALAMGRSEGDWTGDGDFDWKNSADGARGAVSTMTAYSAEGNEPCRRFTTTRERFDGIGLLRGQACRDTAGTWRVTSLEGV